MVRTFEGMKSQEFRNFDIFIYGLSDEFEC